MAKARSTRLNAKQSARAAASSSLTMDRFAEAILAEYARRPYTTRLAMRKILAVLQHDLGVTMASELERPSILRRLEAFFAEAGYAESTRSTLLVRFRTVVRLGLKKRLLHRGPDFPEIPDAKKLPRSVRSQAPPREDLDRLRRHLAEHSSTREGHRLHVLVSLLAESGISLVNALGLRVADVDLGRGTIPDVLRPRGKAPASPVGHVRTLRINAGLRPILERWTPECGSAWLFPSVTGIGPWRISGRVAVGVGRGPHPALRAACIAAGVKPITFEQIRRYHAENVEPAPLFVLDGAPRSDLETAVVSRAAPPEVPASSPIPAAALSSPPELVTLNQISAMVHRSKRTLERHKTTGGLPAPAVEGGAGKPDLYDWRTVRPWLETTYRIRLPEAFPA